MLATCSWIVSLDKGACKEIVSLLISNKMNVEVSGYQVTKPRNLKDLEFL